MAFLQTYKMTNISGAQFESAVNLHNTSIADQFDTAATYNYGSYVMKDGLLYMCISTSEITGDWDPSNWEQHRVFDNDVAIISGGSSTN